MILIKLDDNDFKVKSKKLMDSLEGIPTKQNTKNIARAVGSIAAKDFIKSLNRTSRSSKSEFHHLYEWGEVGKDSARLFKLKRSVSGSDIQINVILKKSKKRVPIARGLKKQGISGKNVTKSYIFKDKAEIMESGKPIRWIAKNNIVFLKNGKSGPLVFRGRGTVIENKFPGGRNTTNSLQKYIKKWETGMAQSAINKSKIFNKLELDISKTLKKEGYTSSEIIKCIKDVCDKYDIKGEI